LDRTDARDLGPLLTQGWLVEQPEAFRRRFLALGATREIERDVDVTEAGEPSQGVYGVIAGAVDFYVPVPREGLVRVQRYGAGRWWGAVGALAGRPRLTTARAAEPTRLFHAPGPMLEALLVEHPAAWRSIGALAHGVIRDTLGVLAEALALPPTARLARRLLHLTAAGQNAPATLDDLAALIGVTRSTVQRALGDLIRAGAVEKGYRRVVIRDRAALERIGGPG
jgi:CRP-like cAMP-binding protein